MPVFQKIYVYNCDDPMPVSQIYKQRNARIYAEFFLIKYNQLRRLMLGDQIMEAYSKRGMTTEKYSARRNKDE